MIETYLKITMIAVVGLYFLYLIIDIAIQLATKTVVVDIITDKERHDGFYIVYGDNKVYKNVDTWVYSKFNSSDIQRRLKKGKSYNLTICGFRFPIFSDYQNIIKIEEI